MGVYAKIDNYTVMLFNTSIENILKKLGLYDEIFDEIICTGHEMAVGAWESNYVYAYNGVMLSLRYDDYLFSEKETVFSNVYQKIRLELSGRGLDYLRSLDFDVEKTLSDVDFWGVENKDYRLTRCDFAYDFVNYKGDFVDKLLSWIKQYESDLDIKRSDDLRLSCGRRSGILYNYRCGSGIKLFYLGGSHSEKMVRIYDKKLEQTQNGVFKCDVNRLFADEIEQDGEIKSWFRIEFQTRREPAAQFLYSCEGDIRLVLKQVFNDYKLRDREGNVLPFILDLFDWSTLPEIKLYASKCYFIQLEVERSEKFITSMAFRSCYLLILKYGIAGFVDILNREMLKTYTSNTFTSNRRLNSFNIHLANMLSQERQRLEDLPGLDKFGERYYLKGGTPIRELHESIFGSL